MKRTSGSIGITSDKTREECEKYTIKFKKQAIMLGISLKNPNVLLKYLEVYTIDLREVMLFKPRIVNEASM
jgi:hypothetical protein